MSLGIYSEVDKQRSEVDSLLEIALRQAADALMIRKAYAWAVLKWHGVPIPAIDSLPTAEEQIYGDF